MSLQVMTLEDACLITSLAVSTVWRECGPKLIFQNSEVCSWGAVGCWYMNNDSGTSRVGRLVLLHLESSVLACGTALRFGRSVVPHIQLSEAIQNYT
jgi:hypothetical protein